MAKPAASVSNCIILRAGKFDPEHGSGSASLNGFLSEVGTSRPERLIIYFHGGLVDREAGMAASTLLAPNFIQADAKPLFIIWESGWKEVIEQNLPAIFAEQFFKRVLRRVTQFVKGKLDKVLLPGEARALD